MGAPQSRGCSFRNLRATADPGIASAAKEHGRVDDTIIFGGLNRDELLRIVDLQLERLRATLAERQLVLSVSDAAKAALVEAGYDPAFGARPLKRTIQRLVQDPLALELLEGRFEPGDTIRVVENDGRLRLEKDRATVGETV